MSRRPSIDRHNAALSLPAPAESPAEPPLASADAPPAEAQHLATAAGASAQLVERDGREQICIKDERGELVFVYDADSGKSTLSVPRGDLCVAAPRGNIELVAGKQIRCAAVGQVALSSQSGVQLQARRAGTEGSRLSVLDDRVSARSDRLSLAARKADFHFASTRYIAETLSATVQEAQLVLDKVDTLAGRMRLRAKSLYQQVQGLHQLRAGRLRAVARDALDMRGRSTTIEADEDVRINGEKINLG